jgi:hypothetical protein
MVGHGEKLGRKKEQAIAGLLSQRNLDEAARFAGIGVTTLRRWMRLPEFHTEYLQARRDVVNQVHARIQQNSGAAASVLLKLMADATTPASVRARAAQFWSAPQSRWKRKMWKCASPRWKLPPSTRASDESHNEGRPARPPGTAGVPGCCGKPAPLQTPDRESEAAAARIPRRAPCRDHQASTE